MQYSTVQRIAEYSIVHYSTEDRRGHQYSTEDSRVQYSTVQYSTEDRRVQYRR